MFCFREKIIVFLAIKTHTQLKCKINLHLIFIKINRALDRVRFQLFLKNFAAKLAPN